MLFFIVVISLAFDLSNENVKEVPFVSLLSYLMHPATVIFGPWIPYQYYVEGKYSVTYT